MLVPALRAAIGGMILVKWVEMMVTGAYPGQKGGSLSPLVRRGPFSPKNALKKKKRVYVLGKVCGHLASASELSGARGGASRGLVWPYPRFAKKSKGYTPI